jgi:hypothetical protein
MTLIEDLEKFIDNQYDFTSIQSDKEIFTKLNYNFILKTIKNKKMYVKCIETDNVYSPDSYYYNPKNEGIVYFFNTKEPFILFHGFDYRSTLINMIYYQNLKKKYVFSECDRPMVKHYKVMYTNFIKSVITNPNNYIKKSKKILNNKIHALFLTNSYCYENLSHYLWDHISLITKLINSELINNIEFIYSINDKYDYLFLKRYLNEEKKIISFNLEKSNCCPLILSSVGRINCNDNLFKKNINIIMDYNSYKIKINNELENKLKNKFVILISIKINRRICINYDEFLLYLLNNLFSIYNDNIVILLVGVFINDNLYKTVDGKYTDEQDEIKKINIFISNILKKLNNEKYSKNFINLNGYSLNYVLKLRKYVDFIIGPSGSGIKETINLTTFGDYYSIDFWPEFIYKEKSLITNIQAPLTKILEETSKNHVFINILKDNNNVKLSNCNYKIPKVEQNIKYILDKINEKYKSKY